jgi:outer membrane protein OmpA-like peptidoglycan-associated protein
MRWLDVKIAAFGGQYRVRVRPHGAPPMSSEERAHAERIIRTLKTGLGWGVGEIHELARALDDAIDPASGFDAPAPDASLQFGAFRAARAERLEDAFTRGFFLIERLVEASLSERHLPLPSVLPPAPKSVVRHDTFFDVRFVDETGQPLSSLPVVFRLGSDFHEVTTNPAGVALLDHVLPSSGSVEVVDIEALNKILGPRWKAFRQGRPPKEGKMFETVFDGSELGAFSVTAALPHTVVVKPPLGNIVLSLKDKLGRVPHANRPYKIEGPVKLEGTTNAEGLVVHEDVFPGDYTLALDVEVDSEEKELDTYEIPTVVLPGADQPQIRMVGNLPAPAMIRLRGLVFDRNKTFVKPGAIEGFQSIRELYETYDQGELLIVGHTDTTGDASVNDPLSLARAKSVEAYLKDDVQAWLKNYDLQGKGRWGGREDRQMLLALPDADPSALAAERDLGPNPTGNEPADEDLVRWFQRTRGLTVDGIAGPKTRTQLITEYMALDGTSLAEGSEVEIRITTHGCGENFPLDETGEELDTRDPSARDDESDLHDRRVELFFFDGEFGIVPKPPGANSKPGSTEYPKWRKRAQIVQDFEPGDARAAIKLIELEDALFRTNSAVLMPEGEAPSATEHGAVTSVGILAKALRFNEAEGPKKLLIAGHTDTEASAAFNRPLSRERAELTFTLLVGKRDRFAALAQARHKVADYKQILSWCSVAYPEVFACDPGSIDDDATSAVAAVRDFQAQYNVGKANLDAEDQPDLLVDGVVGPATWRAIFDVYEKGLKDELGVDAEGLEHLRSLLRFLADDLAHVGFGESHPIEEPTRDEFRSQTNRRVELLFFDPGEEPDLDTLRNDPENSEIYDPEVYVPGAVEVKFPVSDFVFSPLQVFLLDEKRQRMGANPQSSNSLERNAGAPYRLVLPNGDIRCGYADKDGMLTENEVPDFESCRIDWGAREPNEGNASESASSELGESNSEFGLPQTDEEADAFFLYTGRLILHGSRGSGRVLELLANLGHRGAEPERRAEFAKFYKASDNGLINSVHATGRPAPTS